LTTVLARRIIAVSADKAFGKRIATALRAAGGAVDGHASLDELGSGDLQAALVVLHLDGDLAGAAPAALQRLVGDTRLIAILPRSNLAAVVDIMQSSERVAGMLVADELDSRRLSAMATRVLAGDIFGLEKLILWGTQVHSYLVGDYQEKSLCIAQISEFAELMSVRRKYRESIEQCIDEMLMNALYDAPVDEQGRQIFSEIPTKTRISLRVEQKVVVQYACDGHQFAVAVRDAFGTLERATVLRYLHKCLHNEQQIDRKAGGAGLGLYLMTNSSTEVYFNVLPGVATEAVCTFDLEQPKLALQSFGYFNERIDAAGRLAAGPSRRLPVGASHPVERRAPRVQPPPRGLIAVLLVLIAATLTLVGIAAWPRLFGGSKKTSVLVRSAPVGATIEVEGKNAGVTGPDGLVVKDLEIGRAYPIVAALDGHEPDRDVLQARAGLEVTLTLRPLAPTVTIDSQPAGATVAIDGAAAGTTPFTVTNLPAGKTVTVALKKAGYRDATARVAVPKGGEKIRLLQPLTLAEEFARVRVTSEPPGAQIVQNGQALAATVTPAEILVEAGKPLRLGLTMAGKVPVAFPAFTPERSSEVAREAVLVDGFTATVSSSLAGKGSIVSVAHCQGLATPFECVVAPGSYTVELAVPFAGKIVKKLDVGTRPVALKVELGYVDAAQGKQLVIATGVTVRRAVFEVGPRKLTVLDESGATHTATVVVKAGVAVVAN
jgi:hypothetical protein